MSDDAFGLNSGREKEMAPRTAGPDCCGSGPATPRTWSRHSLQTAASCKHQSFGQTTDPQGIPVSRLNILQVTCIVIIYNFLCFFTKKFAVCSKHS